MSSNPLSTSTKIPLPDGNNQTRDEMHTPPSGIKENSSLDARLRGTIKCQFCPETFTKMGKHNRHVKTHTKPYRCDKCTMGFALRTDLSRHKDWHDQELRPNYKCGWSDCSFKTFRKDHLEKHLYKTHQGVGDQLLLQDIVHQVLEQSVHDYMPLNLKFMLAVREKRSNVAKVLLEHGADVMTKSATGKTALHFAAMNDDRDSTLILLCAGVDSCVRDISNRSALDVAAESGHVALVRLILEALEPRMAACQPRDACSNDPVPSNQIVLSQKGEKVGADPENLALLKRTALRWATKQGHSAIVELLLDLGTDPNQDSLLYKASRRGDLATVALLLRSGADPDRESLWVASQLGYPAIVELLLKSGADPNVRGFQGITLLEVASSTGQFEIVKVLLDSGARIRVNGGSGGNAAQRASQKGYSKIVDLLLAYTLSHAERVALVESLGWS